MSSILLNFVVLHDKKIIELLETLCTKIPNIKKINIYNLSENADIENKIQNFLNRYNNEVNFFSYTVEEFENIKNNIICENKNNFDYMLCLDNNVNIKIKNILMKNKLIYDKYKLKCQKNYLNATCNLLKMSLNWIFCGSIFDYPVCENKNISCDVLEGNYIIEKIQDENNCLNNIVKLEKYASDSEILFHIAENYYKCKKYDIALRWYNKNLNNNNLDFVYQAMLKIGKCMTKLNDDKKKIIDHYIKSGSFFAIRGESFYYIGKYYRKIENFEKAENFLLISKKIIESYEKSKYVNIDIYNWKNNYELAYVYMKRQEYCKAKLLCEEILESNEIRENNKYFKKIESVRFKCVEYETNKITDEITKYPREKIKMITENIGKKKESEKIITFSITTCKRLDLFLNTMNSFINMCVDVDMIDRWICIDDNSSMCDRERMMWDYPFIEFYFKNKKERGHVNSMNMIRNLVNTKYLLHLEDDWLFIKKCHYIKPALHILNSKTYNFVSDGGKMLYENGHKIMQVIFNRTYNETLIRNVRIGGFIAETFSPKYRFVIHEHNSIQDPEKELIRWPHFSFNPSLINMEALKNIGAFENINGFEYFYAKKYFYNFKYISCFFDDVICVHTGKKTWENEGKNAYELNDVEQYNKKNKYTDKIQNYTFFKNLDSNGDDICKMNLEINQLVYVTNEMENAVAFNTYGYIKNNIKNLTYLPNKIYDTDGIYIDINKLNLEFVFIVQNNAEHDVMKSICNKKNIRNNIIINESEKLDHLVIKKILLSLVQDKLKKYIIVLKKSFVENDELLCFFKHVQSEIEKDLEETDLFLTMETVEDTKTNVFFSYIVTKNGANKMINNDTINFDFSENDFREVKSSDIKMKYIICRSDNN